MFPSLGCSALLPLSKPKDKERRQKESMVVVQTRRKERVKKVLIRPQRGLLDFDRVEKRGSVCR
jgi:hypothetical protein